MVNWSSGRLTKSSHINNIKCPKKQVKRGISIGQKYLLEFWKIAVEQVLITYRDYRVWQAVEGSFHGCLALNPPDLKLKRRCRVNNSRDSEVSIMTSLSQIIKYGSRSFFCLNVSLISTSFCNCNRSRANMNNLLLYCNTRKGQHKREKRKNLAGSQVFMSSENSRSKVENITMSLPSLKQSSKIFIDWSRHFFFL
jgi:hypothetical protein